jgi:hypothetical protein
MYIVQTPDSNYIFSGSSYTDYNVFLLKYNSSGTQQWIKSFPGNFNNTSNNILAACNNGSLILAIPFYDNSILLNTNFEGEVQWTDTLAHVTSTSIVQTRDGGFAIGGFINDSCGLTLVKTDSFGHEEWRRTFCTPQPKYHFSYSQIKSMQQTADGGFILTGACGSPTGDLDVILIKTDSLGYIHPTATEDILQNHEAYVFPNPWSSSATIQFNSRMQDAELSLVNTLGEVVLYQPHIKDRKGQVHSAKMVIVDPE